MPVRRLLARAVGRLAYQLGIRRSVTLDNLGHAFPELSQVERDRIAVGAYRNMAVSVLEALYSNRVRRDELEGLLTLENWSKVEAALAEGRGLLVATAHFGSWELLGELLARRGIRLRAVVRPLKGALNARLMRNRVASGMGLIPPRGAIRETLRALKRGEVVSYLIDQGLASKSALHVPFFGRPAATTPALALAAVRTGAPVLVVMAAREGERLRVMVEGPFRAAPGTDVDASLMALTGQVTAAVEALIRRYPEQWLWLHRRWKYGPKLAG
jgi:KDO2-lipid IV(A) lauroyltransferase